MWRGSSIEVAEMHFKREELDLVFIDADHTYEGCREDIEAWSSKLKRGGWIGGHDYGNSWGGHWGVKQAADEWVEREGLELERGQDMTWWVRM
jgi:hypothetical protein